MGDFYEMFYEDALVAARALDLTLNRVRKTRTAAASRCAAFLTTPPRRTCPARQEGVPGRDLRAGRRPAQAKGLVRREVVRVVSPGTLRRVTTSKRVEPAFPAWPSRPPDWVPSKRPHPRPAPPRTCRPSLAPRCWTCPPASSWPPSTAGRDGHRALLDELAVLRPREIVIPRRRPWTRSCRGTSRRRIAHHGRRLDPSISRARGAHCCSNSARNRSRVTGWSLTPRPYARPAPWCTTSGHPEGRVVPRARITFKEHADPPCHRSAHDQAPRTRSSPWKAGAPDRFSPRSTTRSRRWAPGCFGPGSCGPSSRSNRFVTGWMPSRTAHSDHRPWQGP